jgi:cobalt-zinc-cadmium efflux system outer membrane protein
MVKLILVVAVILVSAPLAQAQTPVTRLSLEQAVALALRESPTVRAKQHEYRATQAQEITAGLRPNPTTSYTGDQLGSSSVEPQHFFALEQPIELGGKRGRRLDAARAASRVSAAELDDVRRQTVAQVKKAFTDALVAGATLALAGDNLRTLDELERLQRIRADKGDISELDLTRIQVQRFASERDAADARQAIDVARIALRAAVGLEAVTPDFTLSGELGFRDVPLDPVALRRRALDARPDLRAAEAARGRARAERELARANGWSDVTPRVAYERIGGANTYGVGVSVPLRIFDRNQGEIARTRAEIDRADALREAAAVQVLADVDGALSQVAIQREKLLLLRDTYLPKAQRVRDTVEFAYRRGGVSLLDFLDAQRTYRETSLEHLRALGAYWAALYQLEAAVGDHAVNP